MLNRLSNFIQYQFDNFKVSRIRYAIDDITIDDNKILVHYHCNRGRIPITQSENIEHIALKRSDFNKLDKLKIDSCSVCQTLFDSVENMDITEECRNQALYEMRLKVAEITGARII